ncbi:MAG TPA: 2-dehydropantoate 2-reductase N-terminal domain-containing protein, partial [Longilinea sp.]|nr:2-dehydropantoate 2-reductase N-terminal domain-containing protein [Longilinea sp.]
MKIVIIGAGVIGVTYAWQLSLAGNDVTLLLRKNKIDSTRLHGIPLDCLDTRRLKSTEIHLIYRPPVIDSVYPDDNFDLAMVCVNSNQIGSILPLLKPIAGKTDILFFCNLWKGLDEIAAVLKPSQYYLGYPFKAGGGRDENGIHTVIFGTPFTETVIGEVNGQHSQRVKRFFTELKKAGMNPRIHSNISAYLLSHYVWAAANVGAYMQAGSYDRFASERQGLRQMYLAMREGFKVCRIKNVDPAKIIPTCFYYLPLFILLPFTSLLYRLEPMRRMFEGHVLHSPHEVHDMYEQVLEAGVACGVEMPN